MSKPELRPERVLVLAPNGRDGHVAVQLVQVAGYPAETCADLNDLCGKIDAGAGLAIVADEALRGADLAPLSDLLRHQPAWSDFPFILLTARGGGPERNPMAGRLSEILGNATFLERPFHPATFASVVRAAIRGRRRQYEARKHLENLTESESRLQTALTAGNLGAWTLDIATMTLETSKVFRAHFGRLADEPFDYGDLFAAIHPEDVGRVRDAVAQTIESGRDYSIEYRNVWSDSSKHWVDVRARAIAGDDGKTTQLVGVSSDITTRKASESVREQLLFELAAEREALSDMTATLEHRVEERTTELKTEVHTREQIQDQLLQSQKMESIGKLTGGVAHDFNNLLMAVMGNLELLRKRMADDPRAKRLIDGAIQGAERGAALTQRMLAFARQQDLKTGSTDLAQLVIGMRDLLERTLGSNVELHFNIVRDLPSAQVDANQIELAILNLAINSRDAMPNGGTISIDLGRGVPAASTQLRGGEYLSVKVADTGSGMDPRTLTMAVEPFFSTKPLGKGTGLGLSMVHGLAVQLGGALQLTSTVGVGTTAVLWLPIADTRVKTETSPPPPVTITSVNAARILVVDDDPLVAMSTVDMLEDLGHTVIRAHSGKRALEILEAEPAVDLLMTDHAMPGMTGLELAKVARGKWPGLRVLLATGYADLPNQEVTDLPRLAKPYQQAQLRAEINKLLADQ